VIKKTLSKEIVRYGISGGLIALVNIGVFAGLLHLGIRYEVANIIALVLNRVVGFVLNKYFVFQSNLKGRFWREFWGFMAARGFSGLVDYFGLILLVNQFHFHEILSKWIVMIFVIILNYVLGKFLVFRRVGSDVDAHTKSENEQKYRSAIPIRGFLVQRLINVIVANVFSESLLNSSPDSEERVADVLDAGCGEGFVVNCMHAYAPEKRIVGLDISQDALEIAGQINPDVRFLSGSVYELPFASGSVHTVLLSEVLEHLESPVAALHEAERVASDMVVISVPHEPWFRLGNLLTLRHVSRLGNPAGHINHWTHRAFQSLIRENMRGTIHFYQSFPWSVAVIEKSRDNND